MWTPRGPPREDFAAADQAECKQMATTMVEATSLGMENVLTFVFSGTYFSGGHLTGGAVRSSLPSKANSDCDRTSSYLTRR
jgi:hypothetical protein